jgi:hypothetical protein
MKQIGALRLEVQNFKRWAAAIADGDALHGEWELEYPSWGSFHSAAVDLLQSDSSTWDTEAKKLLLYAIARDNEGEVLADSLSASQVDTLAYSLLDSDEPDAKWQIGERLARLPFSSARQSVLSLLATDTKEYVRRRISNALANAQRDQRS